MADVNPLTNIALSRLQALAEGNSLAPEEIQIIESKENLFTLSGVVRLSPQLSVETKAYTGRCKTKGVRILPSLQVLSEEIKTRQESFKNTSTWIDDALKELKKTEGYGWGRQDAQLIWDEKTSVLAATEACPSCRGTAQHPCHECHGIGFLTCQHCEGRGQELCYHCSGRGEDPANPGKQCPICHATRFATCRHCQGSAKLLCPTCQGKGNTPCQNCAGTGVLTQEAHIKSAARLSFSFASTTNLPSGLLRAISRIGESNLPRGHADITLKPEDPDAPQDKATIHLEAKIPYADIKMKFGKKAALVSCTGKQSRLSGVPAFLDDALTNARRELARASQGAEPLQKALTVRAFKDALKLVLSGKEHPNDLRRLYPVGLSANTAKEIMDNMALSLKVETRKMRVISSSLCLLASAVITAVYFFTSLFAGLPPVTDMVVTATLPFVLLAGAWAALSQTARIGLKRKFPSLTITHTQSIGRTGYATLASILLLYGLLLYTARYL